MRRNSKYKMLSFAAIVLMICSLTLGYAAFNQTLNIDFEATVQSGKITWDIHFENSYKSPTKIGNAVLGKIDLNSTTITVTDLVLKTAGDSVSYTFYVVNDGELDAMISSLTPLSITLIGGTEDEQNVLKSAYEYTLKYSDGTTVKVNDKLESKQTKEIVLTIGIKSGITLPNSDITISNLGYTILYTQENGSIQSGSGSSGNETTPLIRLGKKYSGTYDSLLREYYFYEDGSGVCYMNGEATVTYQPGTFTYRDNLVIYASNGSVMGTLSLDGTVLTTGNKTYTLQNS